MRVLLFALLVGCGEKRWTCEACLSDDPNVCAKSNAMSPRRLRSGDDARCSAGAELCSVLDKEQFGRICMGKSTSPMTGCSKEFLSQLRFTCSAKRHYNVPPSTDL